MPMYDYICRSCGKVFSVEVGYSKRGQSQDCRCGGSADYQFPAPRIAAEQKRGTNRFIWDEKQIESEQGKNWRDKGTNGRAGGVGSSLVFDQGKEKSKKRGKK